MSRVLSGGEILADILYQQKIRQVYCVPGESYLAALEGLYLYQNDIKLVTCRHEACAAHMAEAYGKLTGQPGICFVTRGPGATHASIGVHTAFQDSTPMVLFIGQVARENYGREGFQEIDFRQMFQPIAKEVMQVTSAERLPEFVGQAFQKALSGRMGPVVVSLPEDVLRETAEYNPISPVEKILTYPSSDQVAEFVEKLQNAQRPVFILGGCGWTSTACTQILQFAKSYDLPLATSFRCQDIVPNRDEQYIGDVGIGLNPKLAEAIRESDLVVSIGARLGEMTTSGYTLLKVPKPDQPLVHIHPGLGELGKVYQADLMINSDVEPFVELLNQIGLKRNKKWSEWRKVNNANYIEFSDPQPSKNEHYVDLGHVMKYMRDQLPENAIVTNGAGNYAAWLHRYHRYGPYKSQLAPTSGAMGYGLPAAIAAKMLHPERPVVCLAGDGCFMMAVNELATAQQYQLPLIIIVVNNGMYGTIRMHQEMHYPEHVYGTSLINPDFKKLIEAYGGHGFCVKKTEEFADIFDKALQSNQLCLIEIQTEQEHISPRFTISELRDK